MDVETLRKQYLPNKIKVLFIAEAKPDADDRFFYSPQVTAKDYLYLNLMRALYDDAKSADIKYLREQKMKFLKRFKEDGYYLVDAVDEIKSEWKSPQRTKAIKANAENKINEIGQLLSDHDSVDAKIVLIKSTVFDGLYESMKGSDFNFNIIHDFKIYFPSTGRESDFFKQMDKIVKELYA